MRQETVMETLLDVAPLAGAWIEIQNHFASAPAAILSLPSRERGLKFIKGKKYVDEGSRSPRGSVD